MKSIFISTLLFALTAFCIHQSTMGQENLVTKADSSSVRQTALDYIEGYYSGDVTRMEQAIHPDLNKVTPRDLSQTGRTTLSYTTWSGLVEATRAKLGLLDDTARHIKINILNIENEVADVKVISAKYIDYLQEVRLDGQWKIVNVIYTSGSEVPPRLKDFDADAERTSIEKVGMNYLAGISAADAGRLQESIDPEFSRISLVTVPETGKTSLRRQRYEAIIEGALAGFGKQDEVYRNNQVQIIDVDDGLAVVRCEGTVRVEMVQMYKGDGQWKILNSILRPNSSLTLQKAMTVIAGEPMPDFTLPAYGGGNFHLQDYLGKKVMLIFPRGWLGNSWCAYCPYQYLELEQLERQKHIMSKYNVQIAFVMPYGMEMIKDWLADFPKALGTIERIKYPQPAPAAGSLQADYSEWAKKHFPLTFEVKADDPHTLIPVLSDKNRELSRLLKIFTGFWDGISSEQNIASVFIVDQKGILQFKYIGQMTEDRPSMEFLLEVIKNMK